MINFLLKFILISALVCWIIFWLRIIGMEAELNTYYYIPSVENSSIKIYIKNDALTIIVLLVPIINIVFTVHCLLEDHVALLNDIASDVGARLIDENKDNDDNN